MNNPPHTVDSPSKPPQRFRSVRIAVSVFFGVLTGALCLLWVRSYWILHFVEWSSAAHDYGAYSNSGELCFQRSDFFSVPSTFHGGVLPARPYNLAPAPAHYVLGFSWIKFDRIRHAGVSYAYFVILATAFAVAPWAGSKRFSLRTLLIATTLVAVVLGLVCYNIR